MVTPLYAGLLGLFYIGLAIWVTKHRVRAKVGIGVGDDEVLARSVRVHANFAEYVPLILLLLAFAELAGTPGWLLHIAGVLLVLGRILHGIGLAASSGRSKGRFIGTLISFLLVVALSIGLIVNFVRTL